MEVHAFSRHREVLYGEFYSEAVVFDESEILALAQAEAEELAESELPPDPGEWFNWIEAR